MKTKIIIDTDGGHDDALALMLLIKSGMFDIKAITTVAGNSVIKKATRNTQAILDLLQVQHVPIYSGQKNPLKRKLVTAVVHGKSGLDGFDVSKTKVKLTYDAEDKIINLVKENPKQLTILTIGPLSNIGRAIKKAPEIVPLIKKIVIMGGAINVPGNKSRVAEFNFFVDPEAAEIVFKANVKKILIPLDPCNEITLSLDYFRKLKKTNQYIVIESMMKHFINGIKKHEGTSGALVYDVIAAYYLINPKASTLKHMDIVIETKGEYTFGMSVVEKRKIVKKKNNTLVIEKVKKSVFKADLITLLNK